MKNRAGEYQQINSGKLAYKCFSPKKLPPEPNIMQDNELIKLLADAHRLIGKLDGASDNLPDINLFVGAYIRKEALLSSQIEGTQASLDDIFDPNVNVNTNNNVVDVINYIKAINFAIERMEKLPICARLLKEIHSKLMQGVRGQEKNPGEFRKTQNWIGGMGSTLKNATFIPPSVDLMQEGISDLEKFINEDDDMDVLIKSALIHYQFETLHPFLDGNGRIGRMLIVLYLMQRKTLNYPILYISLFLKSNRVEYYDRLMEVRNKGNFEQWIKFFLKGLSETAEDALNSIDAISNLIKCDLVKIEGLESKSVNMLYEYIKRNPIIDIKKTSQALNSSYNTIKNGIDKLIKVNVLKKSNTSLRNKTYEYYNYLEILRKDTAENLS